MTTPTIDLDQITLLKGPHDSLEGGCGACKWEIYNFLQGRLKPNGELTDERPPGVSPVLYWFSLQLNDRLDDRNRQALKKFLPDPSHPIPGPLDGTSDGQDQARLWMLADWNARTALPAWLDRAGRTEHAQAMRALVPIDSEDTAQAARAAVNGIHGGDAWEYWNQARAELYRKVREAYLEAHKAAAATAAAATAATATATAAATAAATATAAAATATGWKKTYERVYRKVYDAVAAELAPTRDELAVSAIALLEAMIHPEAAS